LLLPVWSIAGRKNALSHAGLAAVSFTYRTSLQVSAASSADGCIYHQLYSRRVSFNEQMSASALDNDIYDADIDITST
jgi:hypothetical protein